MGREIQRRTQWVKVREWEWSGQDLPSDFLSPDSGWIGFLWRKFFNPSLRFRGSLLEWPHQLGSHSRASTVTPTSSGCHLPSAGALLLGPSFTVLPGDWAGSRAGNKVRECMYYRHQIQPNSLHHSAIPTFSMFSHMRDSTATVGSRLQKQNVREIEYVAGRGVARRRKDRELGKLGTGVSLNQATPRHRIPSPSSH